VFSFQLKFSRQYNSSILVVQFLFFFVPIGELAEHCGHCARAVCREYCARPRSTLPVHYPGMELNICLICSWPDWLISFSCDDAYLLVHTCLSIWLKWANYFWTPLIFTIWYDDLNEQFLMMLMYSVYLYEYLDSVTTWSLQIKKKGHNICSFFYNRCRAPWLG
jgi:hypothetical protein